MAIDLIETRTHELPEEQLGPTRRASHFRIVETSGAEPQRAEGGPTPFRIGSKEGNTLRIASEAVSRYHLEILPTPHGFLLRDLDSTNGTFVDGYRVREVYLPARASIRIGTTTLAFEVLHDEVEVELYTRPRFGEALGRSASMRELFSVLEKVAPREVTVLLEGESGTGKERLAEAIHVHSARKKRPFVVIDCASVPRTLMESELFGHERGAFTGADTRRVGRFEEAHGGTLFLDEIGELPIDLQPKLLGVLERREVRRVGGSEAIPIDVRVVAATNRDLAREVNRGTFREDLFYRLAVVRVRVPPLRERADDIPLLVEHFVRELLDDQESAVQAAMARVTPETWRALKQRSWPGNVRELRNLIERTLALSGTVAEETPGAAPASASEASPPVSGDQSITFDLGRPFGECRDGLVAEFERTYLEAVLSRCNGNIARAARAAGLDRMYFKRLLRRSRTA